MEKEKRKKKYNREYMDIPDIILVSVVGIAILSISKGVYEQRNIKPRNSTQNNLFGGKTKKKIKY